MKLRYILGGLDEASYFGNIGITEMVKFYRVASKKDIKEMEKVVDHNDRKGFKNLIKKVLNININ